MKFGNYLKGIIAQSTIHPFYWLDFRTLKKNLKGKSSEADTREFMRGLRQEMEKIYQYTRLRTGEFTATAKSLLPDDGSRPAESAKEEAIRVAERLCELHHYVNINKTAVEKIVKKHDKSNRVHVQPFLYSYYEESPFDRVSIDQTILALSRVFEAERGPIISRNVGNTTSFERQSVKYWVAPQDLMPVVCKVMRHLPVYVFGESGGMPKSACSGITSVYYDSDDLHHYHKRISREEGASLMRVRWYGDADEKVFFERKLHHEKWIQDQSTKERFDIKARRMDEYIGGEYDADQYRESLAKKQKMSKDGTKREQMYSDSQIDQMVGLFEEVKGRIRENTLKPTLRTKYQRFAFQIPGDATLRISMDFHVTMSTEMHANGHWRSEFFDQEAIYEFPYTIMEIKLQTEEIPQWVKDLQESNLCEAVPKFSKYGHGVCTLLKDRVKEFPYWMPQMGKPIGSDAKASEKGPTAALVRPAASHTPSHYSPVYMVGANAGSRGISTVSAERAPTPTPQPRANPPQSGITERTPLLSKATKPEARSAGTELHKRAKKGDAPPPAAAAPRAAAPTPIIETRKPKQATDDAGCLAVFSCFGETHDTQEGKQIRVPVRVEPKTFFANERTFLHWLSVSVLLGMMSLTMLRLPHIGGVQRFTGGLFLVVAVFFMVYALSVYYARAAKIRAGKSVRFDDPRGPLVLVICLVFAFLLSVGAQLGYNL